MSLADYGMQRTALTNLQRARRKIRQVTQWYAKAMKAAKADLDMAKRMKATMKQRLQESIFIYAQGIQQQMIEALSQKTPNHELYKLLNGQLELANQRGAMYLAQYEEQVDAVVQAKQNAYDELEAEKQTELEDAKADKEYWEQVHKQAQQDYSQGLKSMFSAQA